MENQDTLRLKRYARLLDELHNWRNAREVAVREWRFTASSGKIHDLTLGDFWPEVEEHVEVFAEIKVPGEWSGQPVELELWLGGEGLVRLSVDAKATAVTSGGLNPFHRTFHVSETARGGESISVHAELVPKGLFGSHIPEPRLEYARLSVPETDVRALRRDLGVIVAACAELDGHDAVPHLLDVVEAAFSTMAPVFPSGNDVTLTRLLRGYENPLGSGLFSLPPDVAEKVPGAGNPGELWSLPAAPGPLEPLPEEAREAVREARRMVARRLERIREEYPPAGRVALTGHAHLDLAWLWPISETRRKARRTFASVLGLMDRFEDFTFNQSSAQLYEWLEEDDPEMFARIRQRVSEGRWEVVGGSWTEPDCQIPGGESFARQFLYGQRYFESRFGKRSTVAWLPDVFGFSPAVPQLLRGAGMKGFFTAKLSWSETNSFPHDLFLWEGLDGSPVTAHMFKNPGMDYNGDIAPSDLIGTWRNFHGKRRHPETLFSFGWGDGGGGPTEHMLEGYERLKQFPAHPRLRMTRVEDFFASLPDEDLPKWVGELYLELHRGTLTSQAKVKSLNRAAEHRLLEAEAFCEISRLHGFSPSDGSLEDAWKTLLLNQFHDILPGSSISEVYAEAHAQLENVCEAATEARDDALKYLANRTTKPARAGSEARAFLVANAALEPRPLSVILPRSDEEEVSVTDRDGNFVATQKVEGGILVHDPARKVPGLGWTSLLVIPNTGNFEAATGAWAEDLGERKTLENERLRVVVGADGCLERVHDKLAGREVIEGRGNQLHAYVDKPREWDAWDIDPDYESSGEEVSGAKEIRVVESGPLRAGVRVEREWRDSRIIQTYRLLSDSRRVDIETHIEWNERRVLLRGLFPLAVRSHEATFETMYGAVRRPTHRNTTWDAARFEVSAHRFADLSETGYGVALLNDGKYGHSARDNILGVSLLRSPAYPDPLADRGEHRFTYSLLPHEGDWTRAHLPRKAFALNSPLFASEATSGGAGVAEEAGAPNTFGLVSAEGLALSLGSLKKAEDGDGFILRLYEPHGARGESVLNFHHAVKTAERVNLLEETDAAKPTPPVVDGRALSLEVRPFEVITLRLAIRPGGS